jgi:transposase-like protein
VTKSCEAVGRRLGISKATLRGWCRQAQIDAGEREGVTSEELAEIKRLKAENRRLRDDVEILRAATTFFAGELDPRNRGRAEPQATSVKDERDALPEEIRERALARSACAEFSGASSDPNTRVRVHTRGQRKGAR